MVAALHELLAALAPGECAVAVSHGAAIRDAVPALLGWPVERAQRAARARQLRLGRARPGASPARRCGCAAYNRVAGALDADPDFTSVEAV